MPDISVIVSTYNRPDALCATLRSLAHQTDSSFEIVVADDGSGPTTRDVVEAWKPRTAIPLQHVWQEDRGFRLAEIRNRAIAASAGNYLIFIDGDCIANPFWVKALREIPLKRGGSFRASWPNASRCCRARLLMKFLQTI